MTDTPLIVRTFLLGVLVAAPVGAMGVLCVQRTLQHGWRAGFATGLGIATADAIYAACAAFGIAAVSSAFVAWQVPLRVVGGGALVYLGVRSLRTPCPDGACEAPVSSAPSRRSYYVSAVALTLTNPMTIMAFGAIFAGSGLASEPTAGSAATATIGVALGSLAWWVVLTAVVTFAKAGLGDRLVAGVTRASGVVVAAFGVMAILSVAF